MVSLTVHEYAHGYVAYRCGDNTAKMLGRLSFNPLKHLDPLGTAFLFLLGFGWAKPVPVNPRNFRNYRRDEFCVSIAGIAMNLSIFIVSLALCVGINNMVWTNKTTIFLERGVASSFFHYYGLQNVNMAMYSNNVFLYYIQLFFSMLASINLGLAIFNLLPIPPLDGYHLLNVTILRGRFQLTQQAFRIAQVVLLVLFFSGAISSIVSAGIDFVYDSVLQLFLIMTGKV